jgi:hypothetical protein
MVPAAAVTSRTIAAQRLFSVGLSADTPNEH